MYFIQSYGTDDQSYRCVIEKVHESFPNIQVSRMGVQKIIKKFLTTGSVKNLKKQKKSYDEDDAATLLVLESVQDQPKPSLRRRLLQLGISKPHIERIFFRILKGRQYCQNKCMIITG